MQLLLDTHTFLWFIRGSPQLSVKAQKMIEATANDIRLSIASPWETGIKVSTGKLTLGRPVDEFFEERMRLNRITFLAITLPQIACVSTLPFHHRDPFDRMLVAQSLTENIPIVSADAALDAYGIVRLW
jgi:PIN domain nuclease of toxin-antitoxin system